MTGDSKDIRVVSTPESPTPSWPVWPGYTPLYNNHDLVSRALYLTSPAGRWMEFGQVLEIVAAYDKALSEARFEVWQLEGLLKELRQL